VADLATHLDVGRRLPGVDITAGAVYETVSDLLAAASALVRSRVPDVDARITALTLNEDLVRYTVAEMVARVMRNPEQASSTSTGPFSVSYAGPFGLVLTEDDEKVLRGVPESASSAPIVGTVGMGVAMPYPDRTLRDVVQWRRRGW
jgi:hypothetical protein